MYGRPTTVCWHRDSTDSAPGVTFWWDHTNKQNIAILLYKRAEGSIWYEVGDQGEMILEMNLKDWIGDKVWEHGEHWGTCKGTEQCKYRLCSRHWLQSYTRKDQGIQENKINKETERRIRNSLENEFWETEFPQIKFCVSSAVAEMIHRNKVLRVLNKKETRTEVPLAGGLDNS